MLKIIAICFALLLGRPIYAQSIEVVPFPGFGAICEEDSVNISYTTHGQFGANNIFIAEIVAPDGGSFQMGTLRSSTSGVIRAFVGISVQEGSHVRVISTSPHVTSEDNGQHLEVFKNSDYHLGLSRNEVAPYDTIIGMAMKSHKVFADPRLSYSWDFGPDASPRFSYSSTTGRIYYITPGRKSGSLVMNIPGACEIRRTFSVYVADCFPRIPKHAQIVDPDSTYGPRTGVVWVRENADYNIKRGDTIFAEPGSLILQGNDNARAGLVYLRSGAAMVNTTGDKVVYGSGAFVPSNGILCSPLSFDYAEAPTPDQYANVAMLSTQLSINKIGKRIEILPMDRIRSIEIYDLLGRLVIANSGSGKINITDLPSGKYFIRVSTGAYITSKAIDIY
jgi:hypothetical protein